MFSAIVAVYASTCHEYVTTVAIIASDWTVICDYKRVCFKFYFCL